MNKKTKIIIAIVLGIALIAGGWLYIDYKMYCKTYLPNNTVINGIDCSGMTTKMAKKALTKKWNQQDFVVKENGETLAVIKDMKFVYDIGGELEELRERNYKFPLYIILCKKYENVTIPMKPAQLTDAFKEQVDALPIYEQENEVQTEDAYVDMSNHDLEIVPEVYGNNIDKKLVKTTITDLIAADTWELNYKEENFYEQPKLTKDSQKLLDRQAYCKKYLAHKITYEFGSESYTITPAEMDKMMYADESGKVKVRPKKVKAFVSKLADERDTLDTDRLFKSTSRGEVMVYGGTYGYKINQSKERAKLTKNLKAMKNVSREPVYSSKGMGWENNGFGSTYVEVDLSMQKLFYYQNGQQMMSCPFVSGCLKTNHGTVTGAFQIVYMATDVTLKGGNKKDKTYYESHVDYWMPFYGDYGLHDADWRSDFGGSIYVSGGSHGCVNMPPASAAQLFSYVSSGTPVIVFY
ncbi:MAG: L,D-transpeptidase family protein [Firmicutes bacterium]|nr:L,D-transpeptidase family protein [Bacillota bacterium]